MQLMQALQEHEAELESITKPVDTPEEAVQVLHDGLRVIEHQIGAATGPNFAEIKKKLFVKEATKFGPKFKNAALKFIHQVTSC